MLNKSSTFLLPRVELHNIFGKNLKMHTNPDLMHSIIFLNICLTICSDMGNRSPTELFFYNIYRYVYILQ